MSWRDLLQPGSFRGIPFTVESDDGDFGRRGQLHEYPQRDKPYFEDLGRKARERNFTAFVLGDDYMAARDKLLAAIETAGPGELVHPWYGRMTGSITVCRVSHDIKEGGMCRFQLTFIENGDLSFPIASSAPGAKSLLAADELQSAAIEDFSNKFSVDNLPAFALDDAVSFSTNILNGLSSKLSNLSTVLSDPIAALKGQLGTALFNPTAFANSFFDLFTKGNAVLSSISGLSDINALNFLRAFSTIDLTSSFNSYSSNISTPTRAKISSNQVALNNLARQALLVQAAGMSAAMPLPVYDDANKLRVKLLTALDDESKVANDTTYLALTDLRAKVFNDMNTKIQGATSLQDIKPLSVQPSLVLTYDLYETVDREAEVLSRNKVRRPGFIPAETLKVLSV